MALTPETAMPPMNGKNVTMSPAAQDLGLGDYLVAQQQDATEAARKKAQQEAAMNRMGISGASQGFGGAASTLGLT